MAAVHPGDGPAQIFVRMFFARNWLPTVDPKGTIFTASRSRTGTVHIASRISGRALCSPRVQLVSHRIYWDDVPTCDTCLRCVEAFWLRDTSRHTH